MHSPPGPLVSRVSFRTVGLAAVVAACLPALARGQGGAGVVVDAQGVLRTQAVADPGLDKERRQAAVDALPGDLRKAVPLDPWGHPYAYTAPGTVNPDGFDLVSFGADGTPGGTGDNADLTSW